MTKVFVLAVALGNLLAIFVSYAKVKSLTCSPSFVRITYSPTSAAAGIALCVECLTAAAFYAAGGHVQDHNFIIASTGSHFGKGFVGYNNDRLF